MTDTEKKDQAFEALDKFEQNVNSKLENMENNEQTSEELKETINNAQNQINNPDQQQQQQQPSDQENQDQQNQENQNQENQNQDSQPSDQDNPPEEAEPQPPEEIGDGTDNVEINGSVYNPETNRNETITSQITQEYIDQQKELLLDPSSTLTPAQREAIQQMIALYEAQLAK